MIQTKLFRRHYAITALVVLLFLFLGFLISNAAMRYAFTRATPLMVRTVPHLFFAKLIDEGGPKLRLKTLKRVQELAEDSLPFQFAIIDSNGVDRSTGQKIPVDWERIEKPLEPYEFAPLQILPKEETARRRSPPLFSPPGPPPGGEGRGPRDGLIRFPGEPAEYLFVSRDLQLSSKPPAPPAWMSILTFGSFLLSVFLGVGFALFLLFRSLRQKAALADSVISELQSGNLKARFPITRMDEMGQAMSRFNKMADEIERLVERLRGAERSRMSLLQDLTHDLRTPVASMQNLLSTIRKGGDKMDPALRLELLSLSQRETDYIERLVEDLLTLAQVSEPRYQAGQEAVSVHDLLQDEAAHLSKHGSGKSIEVKTRLPEDEALTLGDARLLHRLFRNAIENALSFAKTRIELFIESGTDGRLVIRVRDDGPGLSDEALKSFGERRISRVLERSKDGRLSIGLGSVIMKTVAEVHRGSIKASNRTDAQGRVTGAEIRIELPRA